MILKLILPFIFLIPFSFGKTHSTENPRPHLETQWLNLYRYYKTWTGSWDSKVKNPEWFFSKEGRHNPQKEFLQAIEKLSISEKERCRFPARTLYLKKKGFLSKEIPHCPKFQYFKRKLKMESVWMVFASYYVNNPSSAFGHTLFKIKGKDNNNDLLEYGVNFAAQVTTPNPFLYAVLGLVGGFRGNFSLLPYFSKIAEYNDSETRDLWEYKLDLTQEEQVLFLAHLWEMDKSVYDYFYLTENCSYHLLLFLDAIRPSLNFRERMGFFVLPSQTLVLVNETEGLVTDIKVRPSQFKIVKERFKNFQETNSQADRIDFQIDEMDLIERKKLLKKDTVVIKRKRDLQAERAKLDVPPKKLEFTTKDGPHLIHKSFTLSAGFERNSYKRNNSRFEIDKTLLSYRFSFHEYLDSWSGAPKSSELMLGKVEAAYNHDSEKFEIKNFTLFKTQANQENFKGGPALSWGVHTGARNNPYTPQNDLGAYLNTLVGLNWRLKSGLFRITLPQELEIGPRNRNRRLQWHSRILGEFILNVGPLWRLQFNLGGFYSTQFGDITPTSELNQQWSISKNWSLEVNTSLRNKDYQASGEIIHFW
ncbi:MAG: DUF4105 domain-containing protein [Halobacteriovoraceae bacterium]|nr:DUF4105 domain-containing protein [Halobacteriovoraceae bacterium]